MNRTKKWIALFTAIAVVGMLALSACGNKTEPEQPAPAGSGSTVTPAGSSQVESQPQPATPDSFTGEYKLFAVGQNGTYYSAEEYADFMQQIMNGFSELAGADENAKNEIQQSVDFTNSVLTINEDTTASLTLFGMSAECSWTETDGNIEFTVTAVEGSEESEGSEGSTMSNGETLKGTYDSGIIRINDPSSGSEMVFAADGADTSGIKISSMKDAMNSLGTSGN